MSWGDVWVCGAKTRPSIDDDGPQAPWVFAGAIGREEKSFVEATHRMHNTRGSHARKVDFHLQVHTSEVALTRSGAKPGVLTFEPDGLWMAVELNATAGADRPSFVVFTQRVRSATGPRRTPEPRSGVAPRPLAVLALRGHARAGASALEWVRRSPST